MGSELWPRGAQKTWREEEAGQADTWMSLKGNELRDGAMRAQTSD